jgi:hypothetical protein
MDKIDPWPEIEKAIANSLRARGWKEDRIVEYIEHCWKEYERGRQNQPPSGDPAPTKEYAGRKWSHAAASQPKD